MKKVDLVAQIIHRNVCGLFACRVDPQQSWKSCDSAAIEIITYLKKDTKKEKKISSLKALNKNFKFKNFK